MKSLVLIIFCVTSGSFASSHWNYEDPTGWSTDFPVCGGQRQSPINIKTGKVKWGQMWNAVGFSNYSMPINGSFVNNGHSMQFNPFMTTSQRLNGSLFGNNTYRLAQVHFHWGNDSSRGSEHTLDKHRFAMEMHMVHVNEKYADDPAQAGLNKDGYAVVGVFLNVSGDDYNYALQNVTLAANVISNGNATEFGTTLVLGDFLDQLWYSIGYSYKGSLTTPGCNEVVSWILFDNPINVSEDQIAAFRGLKQEDGEPLVDNFRPVQPMNKRSVKGFFDWTSF